MIDPDLMELLVCPHCLTALAMADHGLWCRPCSRSYPIVEGIPVFLIEAQRPAADEITLENWQAIWRELDWDTARQAYARDNLPYIWRHFAVAAGDRFLEIGSGPSFLAFDVASQGGRVVCLDIDLGVLRAARRQFQAHGERGHFVCGDIADLPFRDTVFDAAAGIGVLEHSSSVEHAVQELSRVTKVGGRIFQTVPCFSLTSLVTGSLRYGTIPRVPLLGSCVRLLHHKILRMRRMRFGREESYTFGFLRRLFHRAGFREIHVGFYDYDQTLFKRRPVLGRLFHRLIRTKVFGVALFADVAYVKGRR